MCDGNSTEKETLEGGQRTGKCLPPESSEPQQAESFPFTKTWPLPQALSVTSKIAPLNPHMGLLLIHTESQLILYDAIRKLVLDQVGGEEKISQILQVDEGEGGKRGKGGRVLCAYEPGLFRLFQVTKNKIMGPEWVAPSLGGFIGHVEVTPAKDKFIFSHQKSSTLPSSVLSSRSPSYCSSFASTHPLRESPWHHLRHVRGHRSY
jgi:hypothetical protein